MPAKLLVSDAAPGVRALRLSHPERKGALDDGALEALDRALDDVAGVRVFLVRGEPGAFSAGYDLSSLGVPDREAPLPDARLVQVLSRLERHPIPSVALLEGPAYGAGCELACACDFRVGDPRALFCMPPSRLGVVYSASGLARVARLVGLQRARTLFLTARKVPAAEAQAFGLLDVLAQPGAAEAEALALCGTLAGMAPLALAGHKRGLSLLEHPVPDAAEAQAHEALRRLAFQSDDAAEGVAAFLQKRPPVFRGR